TNPGARSRDRRPTGYAISWQLLQVHLSQLHLPLMLPALKTKQYRLAELVAKTHDAGSPHLPPPTDPAQRWTSRHTLLPPRPMPLASCAENHVDLFVREYRDALRERRKISSTRLLFTNGRGGP